MQIAIIHIDWEGPYKLDQISELNDDACDYGIYQVYGTHPIYGADKLLYIGKADQQTFGVRIRQERWDDTCDSNNIKLYIGRLSGSKTPTQQQWSKEIGSAERLLIYAHKPAYNSQSIQSRPDGNLCDVHVLNWGYHRELLAEVSGARWTCKYDDMLNYNAYGKHTKSRPKS